jgi:hypothetical protein
MSVQIKAVYKIAEVYDGKLLATDSRFRRSVHLQHEDGSSLTYDSAFLMKLSEWIIVFTEHHSFHVYHEGDLSFYAQYLRVYDIEELKE